MSQYLIFLLFWPSGSHNLKCVEVDVLTEVLMKFCLLLILCRFLAWLILLHEDEGDIFHRNVLFFTFSGLYDVASYKIELGIVLPKRP